MTRDKQEKKSVILTFRGRVEAAAREKCLVLKFRHYGEPSRREIPLRGEGRGKAKTQMGRGLLG